MSEKTKVCVTGADPDEPFDIPLFAGDFADAPELEPIGAALIATCEEFALLKWALEEGRHRICYVWKKKAGKNADRAKAGTLAKASGLIKHLSESAYVVTIARDANYGATNWQMEALVYHELRHIRIEKAVVGKGEDAVIVPQFKVRAHDLEMFDSELSRYGLWRQDLKRAKALFEQAPLFTGAAKPGADASEATATITANGKSANLNDRRAARKVVQDAVVSAFGGHD